MSDSYPIIGSGKRAIISGRTGSGKSTLGAWFLNRSLQHWIILNPKWTKTYNDLPNSQIYKRFDRKEFDDAIVKFNYIILNLSGSSAESEYMDSIIDYIHNNFENVGICADELYTLHTNGRAGYGLIEWLTRGRELKQSFIGMTQRPAWISRFCYSEADYIIGMDLTMIQDRKRLYECSGNGYFQERIKPRQWLFYNVSNDSMTKYGAVPKISAIVQ